jgi:hypothetical protein
MESKIGCLKGIIMLCTRLSPYWEQNMTFHELLKHLLQNIKSIEKHNFYSTRTFLKCILSPKELRLSQRWRSADRPKVQRNKADLAKMKDGDLNRIY